MTRTKVKTPKIESRSNTTKIQHGRVNQRNKKKWRYCQCEYVMRIFVHNCHFIHLNFLHCTKTRATGFIMLKMLQYHLSHIEYCRTKGIFYSLQHKNKLKYILFHKCDTYKNTHKIKEKISHTHTCTFWLHVLGCFIIALRICLKCSIK